MFRFIKAFGSTDFCVIDGCSFGTGAINPIAVLVSGMPKLTVLLRNRPKGGCCVHGKGSRKGPLYDILEGAPLPLPLINTIALYVCEHLMGMGPVDTIDAVGPYIDADMLPLTSPKCI